MTNKCKDCQRVIARESIRCRKCAKVGKLNPMFGKRHSAKTKKKMGVWQQGEKNHQWKGNKVGYLALHEWIRRRLGRPKECRHCGQLGRHRNGKWSIHWANVSGKYLRVAKDWIPLCTKCHRIFDRK